MMNGRISFLIIIAVIVGVTLPLSLFSQIASAHPYIEDTIPPQFGNAPVGVNKVIIIYSEAVEIDFSSIKVFDSNGNQIDNRDLEYYKDENSLIVTTPPLESGAYTVASKVLSRVDGHLVPGAFIFGVGDTAIDVPIDAVDTSELIFFPEAMARFPGLVGQTMILGVVIASIFIWGMESRLVSKGRLSTISEKFQKLYGERLLLAIMISIVIIFGSNFAMLIVQAVRLEISSLDVLQTAFGATLIVRIAITIALIGAYYMLQRKKNKFSIKSQIPLLVLSLILIGTTTMMGHGAASEQFVAIILDYTHNLVSSIWIGGLIFLAFVLLPSFSILEDRLKERWSLLIIPRFSTIVIVSLGILIISGPMLMYQLENDLGRIMDSTYGKLIIIKVLIASAMIGIGGYHQFGIQKMAESKIKSFQINKKLVRTLRIEVCMGIALLGIVALLVNGTLPAGEVKVMDESLQIQQQRLPTGLTTTEFSENTRFDLQIKPFVTGTNEIIIKATNFEDTSSISDIDSIKVKVSNPTRGISPIEISLEEMERPVSKEDEDDHLSNASLPLEYKGNLSFGFSGEWQIIVEAQKSKGANEVITLDLFVKPLLADLKTEIIEYEFPEQSSPLYPIYDHSTDTIWISDASAPRIWNFFIPDKRFTMYEFDGQASITLELDNDGKVWFTDIAEGRIGFVNPSTDMSEIIELPQIVPVTQKNLPITLDTDSDNNVWVTIANKDVLLRYDQNTEQFKEFKLPTKDSGPFAVKVDDNGDVWFTLQTIGGLGSLDPDTGQIREFFPSSTMPLRTPETITIDSNGELWISEHQEKGSITRFNPILETFERISVMDDKAFPNGVSFDRYQNAWFAQHTVDELGVYDPDRKEMVKIPIPTKDTWVQFTTQDNYDNVWFVEQKPYKLGMVKITESPSMSIVPYEEDGIDVIVTPPLRYSEVAGPLISAGIIATSLFFVKSVMDRRRINRLFNDE